MRIPRDWAEVTPEWMTEALSDGFPGTVVDGVELVLRDDGTNRRARFRLTYATGNGPETVFVKSEADAHREIHARNGNLFNEAELFASRVELPLDHPRVHRVLIDRPNLDHLIVMEDLLARGADPRDATRPYTVAQVERGVRSLARLHAAYAGFTGASHPALSWVQTWAPTEGFQFGLRRRAPTGLERAGDALPTALTARSGEEIVDDWARYVTTLASGYATLLHADAHIGNTYALPDGGVGFLDWQVARRGNWSQDVGSFVMSALTEDERRASERDLLAAYLDELRASGGASQDAADAWVRYRASAAYGLAIWLSTLGTDGFQRREVSLTLARRYANAFVDLDARGALAELDV